MNNSNHFSMSNPAPEGNQNSSPSEFITLTNGDILQLKMLAQAFRLYNETGMHLTNPIHINRCFQHWMSRIGQPVARPTWKTKEKLLHKHFAEALAD